MTEKVSRLQNEVLQSDEQLYALGDLCLQAAVELDLESVTAAHIAMTGRDNPNEIAREFFVPGQAGPVMSADHAYRSVDVRAIEDLAESGIVRGAFTATNG